MMDPALKKEILQLLDKLISASEVSHIADNDPSGLYTSYTIDSERLRAEIQGELDEL